MPQNVIAGSDNVSIDVSALPLSFRYACSAPLTGAQNIFLAFGTSREVGAAVLPFAQHIEGSTVFLPFKADRLLIAQIRGTAVTLLLRQWKRWRWNEREQTDSFKATIDDGELHLEIPRAFFGEAPSVDFVIYAKDPTANHG